MCPIPVHGLTDDKVRLLRGSWASNVSRCRLGNSSSLTFRFCVAKFHRPIVSSDTPSNFGVGQARAQR